MFCNLLEMHGLIFSVTPERKNRIILTVVIVAFDTITETSTFC